MKHLELVFARERQPMPPTQFGKEIVKYNVNDKCKNYNVNDIFQIGGRLLLFLIKNNYVLCV